MKVLTAMADAVAVRKAWPPPYVGFWAHGRFLTAYHRLEVREAEKSSVTVAHAKSFTLFEIDNDIMKATAIATCDPWNGEY